MSDSLINQTFIDFIVVIAQQLDFATTSPEKFYSFGSRGFEEISSDLQKNCYKFYFEDTEKHRHVIENFSTNFPGWKLVQHTFVRLAKPQISNLSFEPFELVTKFQVRSHQEFCKQNLQNTIYLIPAPAFGTGLHPTTRLVAKMVDRLKAQTNFLDVGCGSGILSLLAYKKGFIKIYAVEIDDAGFENAQANFKLNELKNFTLKKNLNDITQKQDVIVANMLAPNLILLAPQILNLTHETTTLILSGFTATEESKIQNAFKKFRLIEKTRQDEWLCYKLKLQK